MRCVVTFDYIFNPLLIQVMAVFEELMARKVNLVRMVELVPQDPKAESVLEGQQVRWRSL